MGLEVGLKAIGGDVGDPRRERRVEAPRAQTPAKVKEACVPALQTVMAGRGAQNKASPGGRGAA
eukprot:scaffold17910_cov101-Isochrysis_galbana.AAC.1